MVGIGDKKKRLCCQLAEDGRSSKHWFLCCLDFWIQGQDNYGVLDKIMKLEYRYGSDRIIVLAGNNEDMAINGRWPIGEERFFGSGERQ